jgi:hypothetical protein
MSDGLPIEIQPKQIARAPKGKKSDEKDKSMQDITSLQTKDLGNVHSILIGSTTITLTPVKGGVAIVPSRNQPQQVVALLDDGSDRDEAEGDEDELDNSDEDDEIPIATKSKQGPEIASTSQQQPQMKDNSTEVTSSSSSEPALAGEADSTTESVTVHSEPDQNLKSEEKTTKSEAQQDSVKTPGEILQKENLKASEETLKVPIRQ